MVPALIILMWYEISTNAEDLIAGMVIRDVVSSDVGILIKRYNVMEAWGEVGPVWAWEILWTGPSTDPINKNQPYTENGLLGMINAGRMEICHDDD
jgi:hypothetical protein